MSLNQKQAASGAMPTPALRAILAELSGCDGVRGVMLASEDGLVIDHLTGAGQSAEKLAAMSSALAALCAAASEEARIGGCRESIIEAGDGRLLTMSVRYRGGGCVLLVISSASVALGKVLWATRIAVRALAAVG